MSVTPDLLPSISPVADVKIAIGGEAIVPGVFTSPASVRSLALLLLSARMLTFVRSL